LIYENSIENRQGCYCLLVRITKEKNHQQKFDDTTR